MLEVDELLEKLVLSAQSLPIGSHRRRIILTQLIRTLQESGRLAHPYKGRFKGFYDEVYLEALQRLFLHLCERIEDFDSNKGTVLEWVNFLLSRRFFIAASREYLPVMPDGVDPKSVVRLSINDLDQFQQFKHHSQGNTMKGQEVRELLNSDPTGVFSKTHIVNHPEASFQRIALQRLDGFSWHEISGQLDVSIPTLSSFYQRALDKLGPMLRDYLTP
ncbi:MAG: sigma-70 family RNA polymerase sigma factor [Cyanobacteria bacterium P01_F01_bin.150]